jgi:hypothetical protein
MASAAESMWAQALGKSDTPAAIDAERREAMLVSFGGATIKKFYKKPWRPANVGTAGYRTQPTGVVDNWEAAWKIRRHWEEETEKRKAAGKTIY